MYNKISKIHLVGIGGIGMSGIAELLLQNGYKVTGSDKSAGDSVQRLRRLDIPVFEGHRAENVQDCELVVYSSAIGADNPELVAANKAGIPTIRRAEMLAELMRLKYGIAVAGAHGKTSTTSMLATVLVQGGLDPTVVVGGRMDNFGGTNARLGRGEFMVVEADESDGSFERLSSSIAIITNLDREHMEHYRSILHLQEAFLNFANKVPFYGLVVFCGDDPYLKIMQPEIDRRKKTYGFESQNDYSVLAYNNDGNGISSEIKNGKSTFGVRLSVSGRHNLLNALATIAVADELGLPRKTTLEALQSYQGVQRRFQIRGQINGTILIDDYAHHPTEIRATLSAARERFPHAKIRTVFQPHRYSRVRDLFNEFATSFSAADSVVVTDIYSAGEKNIPGVSSKMLVQAIKKTGNIEAHHHNVPSVAMESLLEKSKPGDIILTLGAGDLPNVYRDLL